MSPTATTGRTDPNTAAHEGKAARTEVVPEPGDARTGGARPGRLRVPGPVRLPLSGEQVLFYGATGALVVVGVLDWPVAALVGVGYALARRSS